MSNYKCEIKVVGDVQTNCYFIYNTDTSECIIIDPGDEAQRINSFIVEKGLKPVAILLTHGHFDHVGAVTFLRNKYGIKVCISIQVFIFSPISINKLFDYINNL